MERHEESIVYKNDHEGRGREKYANCRESKYEDKYKYEKKLLIITIIYTLCLFMSIGWIAGCGRSSGQRNIETGENELSVGTGGLANQNDTGDGNAGVGENKNRGNGIKSSDLDENSSQKGQMAAQDIYTMHAGEGDSKGDIHPDENIMPEGEVRLAYLGSFGMEYVENMATKFCLENRGCRIVVEQADDYSEQKAFHDRIFMELAAGKGPELMWVFEEDMRVLSDKGLLMDLDTVIPEGIKGQLFPGVLEAGTLDGRLVAITPSVYFETLVTSDEVWEKDSWTRTEFLDVLERCKGQVEWPVTYFPNRLDYYTFLDVLLTDYSDFIDWEHGTCSFDSEEFVRILKVCREYGKPDNIMRSEEERLEMLRDGKSLAIINHYSSGLWDFSQKMKNYGENLHIVGYPTASGKNGHFLYSYGYLVVNANAGNMDVVRQYIAYLLNYDNQYTANYISVRRDVAWNRVMVDEYTGELKENLGTPQNPALNPLETKPDGSTYQKEYIELLENCVPAPVKSQAIRKILQEELSFYFEGSKSVEEVTRIIQNRVQLYLSEQE